MASPKIGRRTITEVAEQQADEIQNDIESLNPTDAERALGTYDAIIAARQAEKTTLLARTAPKVEAEPVHVARSFDELNAKIDVANKLAPFAERDAAGDQARRDAVNAKAASEIQPLIDKARSISARYDQLLAKNRDAVAAVAQLDLRAVLQRVPLRSEIVKGPAGNARLDNITNHNHIVQLHRLATALVETCAPRPNGVPQFNDLLSAVRSLEAFMVSNFEFVNAYDGRVTTTPEYRQAKLHVSHFLARAETQLANAQKMFDTFHKLSAHVADDLKDLVPADVATAPTPTPLPPVAADPLPHHRDSIQGDFDPRQDPSTWQPTDGDTTVTPLGRDGYRVRRGEVRRGEARESETKRSI